MGNGQHPRLSRIAFAGLGFVVGIGGTIFTVPLRENSISEIPHQHHSARGAVPFSPDGRIHNVPRGWHKEKLKATEEMSHNGEIPISDEVYDKMWQDHLNLKRALIRSTVRNRRLEGELRKMGTKHGERDFAFEARVEKLRSGPSTRVEFAQARLGDVLRFFADEIGIDLIRPEENSDFDALITVRLDGSPFTNLEAMANTHGYMLVTEDGDTFRLEPLDSLENMISQYAGWVETFEQTKGAAATDEEIDALIEIPTGNFEANVQ